MNKHPHNGNGITLDAEHRTLYDEGVAPPRASRLLMLRHGVDRELPTKHQNADLAFFGGRIQLFRRGTFDGPIYRYDMRSAYPAAMVHLAHVDYPEVITNTWGDSHSRLTRYAFREEDGTVGYPPFGMGWHWSWVKFHSGIPGPFSYLEDLYRDAQTADDQYADWIKQVMRCTWGSLLLVGFECYSLELAGIVTQIVHDWIYQAVKPYEEHLLAWNVDSITSTCPIPGLEIGEGMGQWRMSTLNRLTIDPGAFGPRVGHPGEGDLWLSYWPSVELRDTGKVSAPYVYRGGNPVGASYSRLRQAGL